MKRLKRSETDMARTRAAKEKRSNESTQTNKVEGDMCLLKKGLGVCM